MAIDITAERVLSLNAAAKVLPERRAGKRPHVSALYRWAQAGCRGVVLETIQVGGTKCTSIEALQRFFDALSGGPAADGTNERRPVRTERQRDSALAQADKELAELGVH